MYLYVHATKMLTLVLFVKFLVVLLRERERVETFGRMEWRRQFWEGNNSFMVWQM